MNALRRGNPVSENTYKANFAEPDRGELRRIRLPRTPVNRPSGFASHGDDDFPLSVPFFQIPDGLWGLGERVGPVDDRGEPAGFDELLEEDQVLAVLPCDERPQLLVHEPGQYRRPQLAIGASEPPSSTFAPDDDEGSLEGEGAPETRQRRVPADVQDQVVALLSGGEVLARVVDDSIRPDRANHVHLLGAAHAGDVRAERLGDLHGKGAHAA